MDPLRQLEQLRRLRRRPERDQSIGAIVHATSESLRRTEQRLGQLIELWQEVIPAELADRTTLVALKGGVLHVDVESASTRYELDRLLRSGGLRRLQTSFRGTLLRIRLRIGSAPRPSDRA